MNSRVFGYNIDGTLSEVSDGWNSNVNSDGTISLTNLGGPSDQFNTGKTMTGNYFFAKNLLDADGDGNPNYTFHLLTDAQNNPNFGSSLTKTGIIGSGLDSGNFLEAETLLPAPAPAYIGTSGLQYVLVPTEFHPQIPEPAAYSLLVGLGAAGLAAARRRRKSD